MSEILSLARRTNAAIDAASLMPSCRRALRAKKHELRLATRARDMLMLFQRAGTTGSRTLFRRLDREADAVDPAIRGAALGRARAQDLPQRLRTVARGRGPGRARMTG